jgi:23S rRNA (uracil1939-C5)-methyltransferase
VTESFDVDIEFLDASGDGIARMGRRRVAVPFTLPGERVRVQLPASGGGADVVRADTILRASPHRVAPRCRHFGPDAEPGAGPCGGCAWQHIAYPEQLRLKTDLVTRLVRNEVPRAPLARPTIPGTRPEDPWGYRHKVHFVLGSVGPHGASSRAGGARPGALVMGHYVRGSRRVLPVQECPVHDERGNEVAFAFRDEYIRANARAAPQGPLKGLAIRVGSASIELMATLVVSRDDDRTVRTATRRILDRPGAPSSFHVNVHPEPDAFVFGPQTRRIAGPERLREEVAGVSFLISPDAFFQTNVHAAQILVRLVLDAIPAGARVLDLYAGAGLFALPLARRGNDVLAVEENRRAVADGEVSRRLNRIAEERCRFVGLRAERALQELVRPRGAATVPFDAVVLDPPRDGCSPAVLEAVFATLAPATVVYVSCNPEALAVDLGSVARLNYRIRSLQPVDMFPHTAHIETVAVLTRT